LETDQELYVYDANGSVISRTEKGTGKSLRFAYNEEAQLTSVELLEGVPPTPIRTSSYSYDAMGRRASENVDGVVRSVVFDLLNVVAEYDESGNIARGYTQGLGIDSPLTTFLANAPGGNRDPHIYIRDSLGSIRRIADSSGGIVASYEYDSFGNSIIMNGAVDQPYGFAARERDDVASAYFMRARNYDPRTGRFTTADPIGLRGGANLYKYADNDPLRLKDPLGLRTVYECNANLSGSPTNSSNPVRHSWLCVVKDNHHYECGDKCPGGGDCGSPDRRGRRSDEQPDFHPDYCHVVGNENSADCFLQHFDQPRGPYFGYNPFSDYYYGNCNQWVRHVEDQCRD
jgi:RHS repeat-associated protein